MRWIAFVIFAASAFAQPSKANYNEANVPKYTLPEVLKTADGRAVKDAKMWREVRRPEIFKMYEREVYGRAPERPKGMTFELTSIDKAALGGAAVRKQLDILLPKGPRIHVLMYLPAKAKGKVPVFVGLNFNGNHTVDKDPGIKMGEVWIRDKETKQYVGKMGAETDRGESERRWPVKDIVARGYGVVTAYYGDIDPDFDDGFQNGVHPMSYKAGQTKPAANEWGSLAAWAWGLNRMLDYLETDKDVDARRAAVIGHSRLGKAALWAGAVDERWAMVISNDSGEGGAALARRSFGETTTRINTAFPHWFTANFKKYNDREADMPVDQHMLLALIAPRPLYVASASEDLWADPHGEFLSAVAASPVYELLGKKGIGTTEMPGIEKPVGDAVRYHLRNGKHDILLYDWSRYMDFADVYLKAK